MLNDAKHFSAQLLVTERVKCCACVQRLVTGKDHIVVARKGCILFFCEADVLATDY